MEREAGGEIPSRFLLEMKRECAVEERRYAALLPNETRGGLRIGKRNLQIIGLFRKIRPQEESYL